jgi:hypothetical protein
MWDPSPSAHPLWEQKLYSVVSVPLGVILKIAPTTVGPAGRLSRRSPHWWPGPAPRTGFSPSVHPLWEQKLYSVVSVPLGVILKTVHTAVAAVGPAIDGCPVEVPIGGLDQPRVGEFAVRAPALGAEAV